jgi:hypothetical protein
MSEKRYENVEVHSARAVGELLRRPGFWLLNIFQKKNARASLSVFLKNKHLKTLNTWKSALGVDFQQIW